MGRWPTIRFASDGISASCTGRDVRMQHKETLLALVLALDPKLKYMRYNLAVTNRALL